MSFPSHIFRTNDRWWCTHFHCTFFGMPFMPLLLCAVLTICLWTCGILVSKYYQFTCNPVWEDGCLHANTMWFPFLHSFLIRICSVWLEFTSSFFNRNGLDFTSSFSIKMGWTLLVHFSSDFTNTFFNRNGLDFTSTFSFEMGWTLLVHFSFDMGWNLLAHFSFEMGWNLLAHSCPEAVQWRRTYLRT